MEASAWHARGYAAAPLRANVIGVTSKPLRRTITQVLRRHYKMSINDENCGIKLHHILFLCLLLHFLANSLDIRPSFSLLGQHMHHDLTVQVRMLAVTHHFLQSTCVEHIKSRSHPIPLKTKNSAKASEKRVTMDHEIRKLTENSGRFRSRASSPPSRSDVTDVLSTLEKTSIWWQAVDTLVISPWKPASEMSCKHQYDVCLSLVAYTFTWITEHLKFVSC